MSTSEQTKAEEISLEDIDSILAAEDPEFSKELDDVRAVENDQSIVIEAAAVVENEVELTEIKQSLVRRLIQRLKQQLQALRSKLRLKFIAFLQSSLVWAKTRPKEYALWLFINGKILAKMVVVPLKAFSQAERSVKLTVLLIFMMAVSSGWILLANLKGVWLPSINQPILRSFEQSADHVYQIEEDDGGEAFYSAFPQELHEFLFRRIKVNLRRDAEHPNPMGAFEVFFSLDSLETAVELRDREVEFFDFLQRLFEEETFGDLETELGKVRFKTRVKREFNQKLTQGWVKDISFKTFILKP
jgi:flagellar basal body-associated protein FliL